MNLSLYSSPVDWWVSIVCANCHREIHAGLIKEELKSSYNEELAKEILENLKKFPEGAIVEDWGYEQEYEYHKFQENNKLMKKMGIPFINWSSG